MENSIPGIESVMVDYNNPTLISPSSVFNLPFYQTRESLMDVEVYKNFLSNAIRRFRRSRTYKHYKGNLHDIGLDHCQVHGNLNTEMVTIEMHHTILTIFDIALMITEHVLNEVGRISTFDLVYLLKQEHKNNNIPLVMLSLTPHQLYHNEPMFFIHPNMCVGNWKKLLDKYQDGITQDLAFKLLSYFKQASETSVTDDAGYLDLCDQIIDWSEKNASR